MSSYERAEADDKNHILHTARPIDFGARSKHKAAPAKTMHTWAPWANVIHETTEDDDPNQEPRPNNSADADDEHPFTDAESCAERPTFLPPPHHSGGPPKET